MAADQFAQLICMAANTKIWVDDAGKIHLTGVKAIEEPSFLVDLRARTTAKMPRAPTFRR